MPSTYFQSQANYVLIKCKAYHQRPGHGNTENGRAVILIDPLYAQTVSLTTSYQVVAMPNSTEMLGLAVINKTATSFEICDLGGGKGNFSFDWRIKAPRKGDEQMRLAPAPLSG